MGARIFISYARKDDIVPRNSEGEGFVTYLQSQLEYDFTVNGDPAPVLWRDVEQIDLGDVFPSEVEQGIKDSDLLLIIFSRNWIERPFCRQELELFRKRWSAEASFDVEHRIKIVHKNYVEDAIRDRFLPPQLGYTFFEFEGPKKEASRERPFFDRGKPQGDKYYDQVRALSGHLWRAARNIEKRRSPQIENPTGLVPVGPPSERKGRTVYLAKPAPDMRQTYRRVARELYESGYDIVPGADEEIPQDANADAFIDAALSKAEASIHLLGDADAADAKPLVSLQLDRAARPAETKGDKAVSRFQRFIWAPKILEDVPLPANAPLRDPVAVVEGFSKSATSGRIFGDNSTCFIAFVRQELDRSAPLLPKEKVLEKIQVGSQIYVYHRDGDRRYAVNIAKALRQQKSVSILLPASEGNEVERQELHRRYLVDCDSVVLCWASAPEVWAKSSAHELKNWQDLGRTRGFACRSLVIGPPPGELKAEFCDLFSPGEIDIALNLADVESLPADALDALVPRANSADP